jgi:hypothetical protein
MEWMLMPKEPYAGDILDTQQPFTAKSDVVGTVVCIMNAHAEERGFELIPSPSRAFVRGSIQELIVTDEPQASPGTVVNRVAYVCFFEIEIGGIVLAGDMVEIGGQELGQVAGFDLTHAPNHMNVIVHVAQPRSGAEMGVALGDRVTLRYAVERT